MFFAAGEGLIIFSSVIVAYWTNVDAYSFRFEEWMFFKVFLIAFVCQACLYFNDLYDLAISDSLAETSIRLLQSLGFSAFILAGIYLVFPALILRAGVFNISVVLILSFIIVWRLCYMLVLNRGFFNQKIILLGSSELGDKIEREILERKDSGYVVAVKVMEEPGSGDDTDKSDTTCIIRKSYNGLCELATEYRISKIIVAITERRGALPTEELLGCRVNGIDILDGNSFYEMLTGKFAVEQINPAWLIFSEGFKKSPIRRFVKRAEDLLLSSILLSLLSPLVIVVAILVKIDSKGAVIYSQDRVGKDKKSYRVHKFRSMVVDAEKSIGPVWAEDDDRRTTRVGKWIRKLRIDEVPQIWNVLKGDMSFVGPRPEREFFVKQLEDEIPYYGERFSVKPGITGWAQISYGYGATVKDAMEKLNYDLFYIKNMSTFMDLMITLRTVKTVLFEKGAR